MTQNALDYSQNPSGADLMDVFLAGMADNQLTNHSGVSRPSYAKAGTFWIDTSASPWALKQFTGTSDVTVGTLDQTNLYFTARRALGDKNGNDIATTYLTTSGTAAKATADANGNVITSTYLTTTGTAARATADASGNNIASTYATKTELDQKSSFKLFHHDWFDYQLNDMAWLRADTFSWQDGTVYSDAYQHLVDDITNGTLQTETIAGHTITYTLAEDGHKIVSDANASAVEGLYNDTGIAWYYILDITNQRFKLPRTKWGFTGLRDSVGKYVPESLPNIKGKYANASLSTNDASAWGSSGCFAPSDESQASGGGNPGTFAVLTFNASRSSSTYQDNAPVQQRATQMYLYFYVGQFSQTATEQTAGLNSELFNGKADIDLNNAVSNASLTAKETIITWGMPDYSSGVSKTVTGFTADSDGWLSLTTGVISQGVPSQVTVNGSGMQYAHSSGGSIQVTDIIPIRKNDVIVGTNISSFWFYKCIGV